MIQQDSRVLRINTLVDNGLKKNVQPQLVQCYKNELSRYRVSCYLKYECGEQVPFQAHESLTEHHLSWDFRAAARRAPESATTVESRAE